MSLFLQLIIFLQFQIFLPIQCHHPTDIKLSEIGNFGHIRKARKNVPEHYHIGVDIKRPSKNYDNEPIFALAGGVVISVRDDGPFAQIIIEHFQKGFKFWTLYEHISGIAVKVNDKVKAGFPIARFMNREELNKYGWQFDHFHLEVLKIKPMPLKPDKMHPERFYTSYSLICFKKEDLDKYYYEPLSFIEKYFSSYHPHK
jgi:hypothetical protein